MSPKDSSRSYIDGTQTINTFHQASGDLSLND